MAIALRLRGARRRDSGTRRRRRRSAKPAGSSLSKGGATQWVHVASESAGLLPHRKKAPFFLAWLRPSPARAPVAADVDPNSGRARPFYRQAEEPHPAPAAALVTHLAEAGESAVTLMAKSRHRPLQTLQRYARPGPGAVADMTARNDPEALRLSRRPS